jgi:hypothetical protein
MESEMSGPIIRQYGVPNWDEIFGKKDAKQSETEKQPDPAKSEKAPDSKDATDKAK